MSVAQKPAVFVSSTCYDLKQVRENLREFIAGAGYDPMLSEHDSFPVDPSTDVIENCRKAVGAHADIFVLIVGNRHGSVAECGRSITNIEYLAARARGLPIYVFVLRSVLDAFRTWKKAPENRFPDIESPEVFEFIDSVQSAGHAWIRPFDTAQDITGALRRQWAHLFCECLHLWTKSNDSPLEGLPTDISLGAWRLSIERPRAWEIRLLDRVLRDKLTEAQEAKWDLQNGLSLGPRQRQERKQVMDWVMTQFAELVDTVRALDKLLNTTWPEAAAAGNPRKIIYVAKRVGDIYRTAIDWSLQFRRVHVDDDFRRLLGTASRASCSCVDVIEALSTQISHAVKQTLDTPIKEGETVSPTIRVRLDFPAGLMEELEEETVRVAALGCNEP
ncbi:MAG: DUF4062 domain-containing protein [Phycisphaerae bacterium]|jgi:hypothetical protein